MTSRPTFRGVDHVSLSVTDPDRSEASSTPVLDFTRLMDFGDVRTMLRRPTSFLIGVSRHPGSRREPFTELHTGLDHISLVAESGDELVAWTGRFDAAGVSYTPIREMPFGHHLNFRDPDDIPWELHVPSPFIVEGYRELREQDLPSEEIAARVQRVLDASS